MWATAPTKESLLSGQPPVQATRLPVLFVSATGGGAITASAPRAESSTPGTQVSIPTATHAPPRARITAFHRNHLDVDPSRAQGLDWHICLVTTK